MRENKELVSVDTVCEALRGKFQEYARTKLQNLKSGRAADDEGDDDAGGVGAPAQVAAHEGHAQLSRQVRLVARVLHGARPGRSSRGISGIKYRCTS